MAYLVGNLAGVAAAVVNEFRRVATILNGPVDGVVFNTLYAQPDKLTEGLTVVADGTVWDPLTLALGHSYKVCYLGGAWRRDA